MTHRFAGFEIDEQRRELRLEGREILLQPRIFDLLSYLVRHRDRVVGKDELLENLWPDVVVGEGSLQRVVSLARSALRQGGCDGAIRTFSRQGYRFTLEAEAVGGSAGSASPLPECLERARRLYDRGRWHEAHDAFLEADGRDALETSDLERWALAAMCAGRAREAIAPLERAVAAHGAAGDRRGSARVALQLAQILFERRQLATSKGWCARVGRLLEDVDESREHGLMEWLRCRHALVEGDVETCLRSAERALTMGRRLEDPDLEALGLLYSAHAVLARGDARRGVALLDEAAATVLSGDVTPWFGGLVYCGVIWACRNRGDWQRAGEWTDRFTRWCEGHGLANFPGTCRLHRAEVLCVRGALDEAEKEIASACDELPETAPWAEGDAFRVLGDMHLMKGRLQAAERAFRRAHELGWDAQPGLAMLLLARGEREAALHGLEHALEDTGWASLQRRGLLLAHMVHVAAFCGELDRARVALDELDSRPELWSTPAFQATVARARAEMSLGEEDRREAMAELRRAVRLWTEVGSPLPAAEARLRLARLLLDDGESRLAELELSAVEALSRQSEASELLTRCRALRKHVD